jgi:hypothetical protein
MNYTKNTVIFAFAALLIGLPLANSNAFGDGDASLDANCGVTIPPSINMGSFAVDADGTEVLSTMATTGTVGGTLELSANDWIGVGTAARGSITLVNVLSTETFTVNSLAYTAVSGVKSDNTEFSIDTSMTAAATDLAASINARDAAAMGATGNLNAVLLKTDALGTAGNAFTLAETVTDAGTTISGSTLSGAEAAGVVHMQSEATKFVITTDGTTNSAVAYSAKNVIGQDSINTLLTATTDPANDVNLYMQISGVGTLENLPYDGALTQVLTFTVVCNA